MAEETFITDFEFKEDIVDAMNKNPDIVMGSKDLEKQMEDIKIGTLLEVEKKIGSSITILSVKEVNEESLMSAFI